MSQVSQVTISSPGAVLCEAYSKTNTTDGFLPLLIGNHKDKSLITVAEPNSDSLLRIRDIDAPHSGYIRIVELNKPSTRNAISRPLLAELSREVERVQKQYDLHTGQQVSILENGESDNCMRPTRALIIASAFDSCFCSGADLKERRGFTLEQTNGFLKDLRATFAALSKLPIPTISAVGSLALGGGLELALATHFRVVSSNATMGFPETRLGIIPGAGGTYRLSALIGVSEARKLVLTGRRVAGTEAYRLGIADHLVDVNMRLLDASTDCGMKQRKSEMNPSAIARQEVLAEAVKLAEEICQGSPAAIRAAIQAFRDGPNADTESAMYDRVMKTEDRNEALRAFAEKRKPVFRGQ